MIIRLGMLMGMKDLEGRDPAEVRSVFIMLFMTIFLIADTMLIAPNIKLIMEDFGKTEAQIGLISTVFIFLGAGIALVWGYFADRYTRKKLVVATIILGEIPCLLTGYVRSYDELLYVRALTGLGVGGIFPLIYSMLGDLVSDRERSSAAAWIGLAEGLGMAGGMLLAGNLGGTTFTLLGSSGWRLPFVLAALPNFALVPLFWFTCREPARGAGEKSIQEAIAKGLEYMRRIKLKDYAGIFTNRTNIHFILQGIPGTIGWGVLPYWTVTFFVNERNLSIPMATNLSLVVGAGMVLGSFIGGLLGNWLHSKDKRYLPLFCGFTTLIGLSFFFVMFHYPMPENPVVSDIFAILPSGVVAGFFITLTNVNTRTMVLNVNPPENRGAMMSVAAMTDNLGKGAGPLLGGLMIGHFGYLMTMDLANSCWILCALIFIFLMAGRYPKDVKKLDELMAARAKEMEEEYNQ